jgi:hypothetical protein
MLSHGMTHTSGLLSSRRAEVSCLARRDERGFPVSHVLIFVTSNSTMSSRGEGSDVVKLLDSAQ